MDALRFVPFSSAPKVAFWQAVAERKLRDWRLDDAPRPARGFYWAGGGARVVLDAASLRDGAAPPGATALAGRVTVVNTLEAFRRVDKAALLRRAGDALAAAVDDGAALADPARLAPFEVVAFADLKRHAYVYWFAFPALVLRPAAAATRGAPAPLDDALGAAAARALLAAAAEPGAPLAFAWTGASRAPLREAAGGDVFCVLDPAAAGAPGWPARNLLWLLARRFPERRAFRIALLRGRGGCVVEARVAGGAAADVAVVGWEANASGRMAPRSADLAPLADPGALATAAAALNLELMRWRLLPGLDVEKLAATRVLLLGAGTLGCAVARSLVAWGVTRVTLVDGGTVACSNPARQGLYTVDDAKAQAPKAAAAAAALRRIAPGSAAAPAAFVGKKLTIAMPGHALPAAGTPAGDAADAEVHALDALVADADCVFLLTDTRESRWLPTVVAAARGTLLVNVALGLDTFVVQRHGHGGNGLGCYFCGDVAAPTNSTRDRTLDQQCTVSRPGLAPAAAALAVELLVALLHHPREGAAPADPATPPGAPLPGNRPLGLVPHSIRGFLTHYATVLPTTPAFDRCAACAPAVVAAYRDRGVALVRDVGADPGLLERLSGLADLKGAVDGAAWAEADEF